MPQLTPFRQARGKLWAFFLRRFAAEAQGNFRSLLHAQATTQTPPEFVQRQERGYNVLALQSGNGPPHCRGRQHYGYMP